MNIQQFLKINGVGRRKQGAGSKGQGAGSRGLGAGGWVYCLLSTVYRLLLRRHLQLHPYAQGFWGGELVGVGLNEVLHPVHAAV